MKRARTLTLGLVLSTLVLAPLPGCAGGQQGGGPGKLMGLALSLGAAVGSAFLIKEIT